MDLKVQKYFVFLFLNIEKRNKSFYIKLAKVNVKGFRSPLLCLLTKIWWFNVDFYYDGALDFKSEDRLIII